MTRGERFVRCFAEADWLARLILTTCFAALLNFGDCYLEIVAAHRRATENPEFMVCYFGPPPAFFPRLLVLGALLGAALAAFKRTTAHRVASGTGLAVALLTYVRWWTDSYYSFKNFEVDFLNHREIKQVAYLYSGSWLDVFTALSIIVCLVLVLDRLFDGEKCMST